MKGPYDKAEARLTAHLAARAAAAVAGVFALVAASLLLANYVQVRRADPLNNPSLLELRARFVRDAQDARLREDIRTLDWIARKAFFTTQSQIRGAALLLAGAGFVLVLCLQIMAETRQNLPRPAPGAGSESPTAPAAARAAASVLGAALLLAAGAAAVLSHRSLSSSLPAADPRQGSGQPGGTAPLPAETPRATETVSVPAPAAPQPSAAPVPVPPGPTRAEIEANWPCFRGPDGNGIARTRQAPAAWDAQTGTGILWRARIARSGYSSPVVWGDLVVVTGGDRDAREVYGFDAVSGAARWTAAAAVQGAQLPPEEIQSNAGYAAPSPATDGSHLFAIFATGELLCLDMAGRSVWSKNLGVPENHYGHSSSLLAREGRLFVQLDYASRPRLIAFDTATGDTAWEAQRGAISWASPICVNTGSRAELILADSEALAAYSPDTGVELWRLACMGGEVGTSPAYADGMVFAANEGAPAVGVPLTNASPAAAWEWDEALPDTASPLACGGYVFLATSGGSMYCLKAATGKTLWEHDFGQGFQASPIAVGDQVYAQDTAGVMHVFDVAEQYRGRSEGRVGERVGATPAFVGKRAYIRGETYLFCAGEP
jgi:outer membrane protein assembly factor BamB